MPEPKNSKWFHDYLSPDEGHIHGIRSIPFAKQTKYQYVEIMETASYGRCLVLDGKMNSSEADEFIYHEALVHPALLTHPNPRRVAILGGGEGATLREVLRHKTVEHVLMVDIDQEVVEACKTHLPDWHQGAFDDPRVDLKFLDARQYLEETKDTYDIMIIDLSEPVEEGPAYLLYTKEFYKIVQRRLTKEGIIALQAGTTAVTALLNLTAVTATLKTAFPVVAVYQATIPSFGLPWGFALASKKHDPMAVTAEEMDRRIADRIKGELVYFDGLTHHGQFFLPKCIRAKMAQNDRIIEDNHPLFTYH